MLALLLGTAVFLALMAGIFIPLEGWWPRHAAPMPARAIALCVGLLFVDVLAMAAIGGAAASSPPLPSGGVAAPAGPTGSAPGRARPVAAVRPQRIVPADLEVAAPLIDAVFGSAPAERRIPYTLTGLARSGVNRAAKVLLELLSLVGSRAPVSRVFGLLQQPLVARRFGLDDAGLDLVHDWLQDAGVHWGFDAAHREAARRAAGLLDEDSSGPFAALSSLRAKLKD